MRFTILSVFAVCCFLGDVTADEPGRADISADMSGGQQESHWAFRPVRRPQLPRVRDTEWGTGAVDRFVLARLEAAGLEPSRRVDQVTLIRRVTFDLTGLPPTPDEVADFTLDRSAGAFAKVVDRLLASPRHGERWGRHWLDVARYADTKGLRRGRGKPHVQSD